jgi:hypothetical protein
MTGRRPAACRCCLRPAAGIYCEGCAQERTRSLFAVRSVISELWGHEGMARFDAAMRSRRLDSARRGRSEASMTAGSLTPEEVERDRELNEPHALIAERGQLGARAAEAEAMDPTTLRQIVREVVEAPIDPRQWQLELAVEEQERRDLWSLLEGTS